MAKESYDLFFADPLEYHWVLTSLRDLRIFESKEGRGSYNLLLLVLWFDVVGILYHSVL